MKIVRVFKGNDQWLYSIWNDHSVTGIIPVAIEADPKEWAQSNFKDVDIVIEYPTSQVTEQVSEKSKFPKWMKCPFCAWEGPTDDGMWTHAEVPWHS